MHAYNTIGVQYILLSLCVIPSEFSHSWKQSGYQLYNLRLVPLEKDVPTRTGLGWGGK